MTEKELAEIEARATAATEGPWKSERVLEFKGKEAWDLEGPTFWTWDGNMIEPDAVFIAAARTDVPVLVAEVRRLREVIDYCYTFADKRGEVTDYIETHCREIVGDGT